MLLFLQLNCLLQDSLLISKISCQHLVKWRLKFPVLLFFNMNCKTALFFNDSFVKRTLKTPSCLHQPHFLSWRAVIIVFLIKSDVFKFIVCKLLNEALILRCARCYFQVNKGPLANPIWNVTTVTGKPSLHDKLLCLDFFCICLLHYESSGKQWLKAELAVSTFWPNEYQVKIFFFSSGVLFRRLTPTARTWPSCEAGGWFIHVDCSSGDEHHVRK